MTTTLDFPPQIPMIEIQLGTLLIRAHCIAVGPPLWSPITFHPSVFRFKTPQIFFIFRNACCITCLDSV